MSGKIYVGLALAVLLSVSAQAFAADPKLPYGPEGKGRFGAYYTKLNYTPEWDALWRVGDKADVVVRFDEYDYRVVFWRGTNYMPFWVNEKRVWDSCGCVERSNASPKWDKLCKYSFASIIESNDARVVIRWRYALVDKDYKLINTDPMTNWNDWVDEYYTIYPDAMAVRTVKLFSSDLTSPISIQQCLSLISSNGGAMPFRIYPSSAMPDPKNVMINIADWPVTGAAKRPIWRFDGEFSWKPYSEDKESKSWMLMTGLAKIDTDMQSKANSWISAPKLTAGAPTFPVSRYDQGDKAYHFTCMGLFSLKFKLEASATSPIYNPAFVIKGWGKNEISLNIDGKPIKRGPDFRYGFRKTDNVSDLIIWVKKQSTKPVSIEIKPLQGGK